MSRAAVSKSRADKGSKPAPAHTPVVAHEIVPGKFNDQDWTWMLDKDGAEDFIEDIVEEIVDTSLDKIYKLYLDRQLLPFTVTMAKDAILQVIEWQFLSRDEGETELESTGEGWIEDEEPDAATTDCWAQGSVPKNIIPRRPISPVAEEFDEHPDVIDEEPPSLDEETTKVTEEPEELEDKVSDDERPEEEEKKTETVQETKQKKKTKFKPYTGRLKSASVSQMTTSLDDSEMNMVAAQLKASFQGQQENLSGLVNMPASCHSILKVQAGRPPGNKDVLYDDRGNVVAVVKLNPDRLPSHRIKVNYQVVDPSVEAAKNRLDAMKHGRYSIQRMKKKKSETRSSIDTSTEVMPKEAKTPLPPPLIEAMELAPGVTVKEGDRTRRGPVRYVRKADLFAASQKNLNPVNPNTKGPTLNVVDLLDRHTPILRPIRDSPPLPPIVPHPPNQARITT
ncbi:uncharacterized protein LOC143044426 isoform X1 [Mytilus galloprovincialis]|uniref:uncharacterized protein LOC143044426 isoform X1 n=1 Tax=Mytilus galloprovincialis TaxID=29158 RepID=UPI003F7BAF9B